MVPTVKGDTMTQTVPTIMTANMLETVMGYMYHTESLMRDDLDTISVDGWMENSIWDAMRDAADKMADAWNAMEFLLQFLQLNEQ